MGLALLFLLGREKSVDKIKSTDYRQPTPNRGQSSLLELPRCEGGKDHKVGLTDNRLPSGWGPLTIDR